MRKRLTRNRPRHLLRPLILTTRSRPETSSTRSTRSGRWSRRSSSSACRSASRCSKPASAARARRSTCSWNASSTPASAAFCSMRSASPSCSATATASSAYHWFFLQDAPATYEGDRRRVPGVLALPVRLRRHLLHDHLRRDDRPHRLRRRPALQRLRLGLHLSDHRPLGLGTGRLPGHDGQPPMD